MSLIIIPDAKVKAQFRLPEYETFKLDNGLTVYLMEKHDVPLLSVSVVINAGAVYDKEISGLAAFTAEAIRFGTNSYAKEQIDSLFNFYGSALNTFAVNDYSGLTSTFMSKDAVTLLPVIKEILTDPVFPDTEIQKRKSRWIAQLDLAKESPRSVIAGYFNKLIFYDGVYANPVDGTKAGIQNISSGTVKDFFGKFYGANNAVLALVGDFETEEMKKIISGLFGDWKKTDVPSENVEVDLHGFSQSNVYLIDKNDSFETTFMIGGVGIKRSNPDYTPLQVVNTILGGRFTSWLNDELRVNAGLTYGARSRFQAFRNSGTFYILSFTGTGTTFEAIDLALKTYNRLFENGIDDITLQSAKNYIKGQFPPDYESGADLAAFLTSMFIYGIDESFINNFEKQVDELTVEKANQLVRKYFPKENLQFVLIGKSSEIKEQASAYGNLIEKEISEDGF